MDEQQPSIKIDPGQHQNFIYVGEEISNQIVVRNLGAADARFRLTSTLPNPSAPPAWDYYGDVVGRVVSFWVHFPTAKLTVYDEGTTPIVVAGDGIRPS
jgi:hypothetical protein